MKTVILSAHTDDAIWSIGEYMQTLSNVTILSVYAGIPKDPAGMQKHVTLRREHQKACDVLGVDYFNGDFLDDVYIPRPTEAQLCEWLGKQLYQYDNIIAPIGIHHPDHVQLRSVLLRNFKVNTFYMDLPYATLYPSLVEPLRRLCGKPNIHKITRISDKKKIAVMQYASQLQSDHILGEILVEEQIYD